MAKKLKVHVHNSNTEPIPAPSYMNALKGVCQWGAAWCGELAYEWTDEESLVTCKRCINALKKSKPQWLKL